MPGVHENHACLLPEFRVKIGFRGPITRIPNQEDNNVRTFDASRKSTPRNPRIDRLEDWGVVLALLVVELCILLGGVVLEDLF